MIGILCGAHFSIVGEIPLAIDKGKEPHKIITV